MTQVFFYYFKNPFFIYFLPKQNWPKVFFYMKKKKTQINFFGFQILPASGQKNAATFCHFLRTNLQNRFLRNLKIHCPAIQTQVEYDTN